MLCIMQARQTEIFELFCTIPWRGCIGHAVGVRCDTVALASCGKHSWCVKLSGSTATNLHSFPSKNLISVTQAAAGLARHSKPLSQPPALRGCRCCMRGLCRGYNSGCGQQVSAGAVAEASLKNR